MNSIGVNWVEILVRKGYSFGSWGKRPEPRRVGYGYNRARSGARAADLPAQARGLAAQVADGRVRNVIILIGANDFASWNGTYGEIYYNKITDAQVSGKVKKMVADITAAVDTVRTSRTVPMVISTIPNRSVTQPFLDRYPDPAKRMRVTNAVRAVNDGIIAMATAKGIAVADLFEFSTELPTRADANGNVPFGEELINIRVPGDEPHHLLLGDNEHIGTVFNGRLANFFMYEGLESKYPLLRPISEAAILSLAGI